MAIITHAHELVKWWKYSVLSDTLPEIVLKCERLPGHIIDQFVSFGRPRAKTELVRRLIESEKVDDVSAFKLITQDNNLELFRAFISCVYMDNVRDPIGMIIATGGNVQFGFVEYLSNLDSMSPGLCVSDNSKLKQLYIRVLKWTGTTCGRKAGIKVLHRSGIWKSFERAHMDNVLGYCGGDLIDYYSTFEQAKRALETVKTVDADTLCSFVEKFGIGVVPTKYLRLFADNVISYAEPCVVASYVNDIFKDARLGTQEELWNWLGVSVARYLVAKAWHLVDSSIIPHHDTVSLETIEGRDMSVCSQAYLLNVSTRIIDPMVYARFLLHGLKLPLPQFVSLLKRSNSLFSTIEFCKGYASEHDIPYSDISRLIRNVSLKYVPRRDAVYTRADVWTVCDMCDAFLGKNVFNDMLKKNLHDIQDYVAENYPCTVSALELERRMKDPVELLVRSNPRVVHDVQKVFLDIDWSGSGINKLFSMHPDLFPVWAKHLSLKKLEHGMIAKLRNVCDAAWILNKNDRYIYELSCKVGSIIRKMTRIQLWNSELTTDPLIANDVVNSMIDSMGLSYTRENLQIDHGLLEYREGILLFPESTMRAVELDPMVNGVAFDRLRHADAVHLCKVLELHDWIQSESATFSRMVRVLHEGIDVDANVEDMDKTVSCLTQLLVRHLDQGGTYDGIIPCAIVDKLEPDMFRSLFINDKLTDIVDLSKLSDEHVDAVRDAMHECSICYLPTLSFRTLECGHKFHADCVGMWIQTCRDAHNPVCCPYCRAPIH